MPLFMLEIRPHADVLRIVEAKLLSDTGATNTQYRQNDDDDEDPHPVCGAASASD